jgi:acylphosphatase
MNIERQASQFLITGIVQGVGYRMWTERTARQLGVHGWVRNLFDGRVEIHAEGEQEALEALEQACKEGPRSASVTHVKRSAAVVRHLMNFEQIASAPHPD